MSKKIIAGAGVVASFAVALAPMASFALSYTTGDQLYPNTHQDALSVTLEKVCRFGYTYTDGTTVTPGYHTDGTKIGGVTANPDHRTLNSKDQGLSYGIWDITATNNVKVATAYDTQIDTTAPFDTTATGTAPTAANTTVATDTAYGIMENATVNTGFAKTALNVICNNVDGYNITAVSTPLYLGGDSSSSFYIDQTSAAPAATASTYSFQVAAVANADNKTAGTDDTDNRTVTLGSSWLDGETSRATVVTVEPKTNKSAASFKKGDVYEMTYGVGIAPDLPAGTYTGTVTYTLAQL